MIAIMKAASILNKRVADSRGGFAEYVVWLLAEPLPPSEHRYKYRLAYVMNRQCVVRYDNERGKGDHRHFGSQETKYTFSTPRKLIADFAYGDGAYTAKGLQEFPAPSCEHFP